jgi:UDP-2,4-diacetamido-2,4,6-trideoxy-beta-L-altropyranose hydrolase
LVTRHIAFRTDASNKIGTGHFMRCLTLADGLKQRGAQIRFVSRHLPEYLRSMLVAKGHEFALLDSVQNDVVLDELAHSHWLEVSQAQDAADSIRKLADHAWDWLIVDHYALDARWECALRSTARQIKVIDDIADRQHDCDMLLDQNFYADMEKRYIGKVPKHCQLLLGPSYALLRDEFRQLHEQVKPRKGPVKRVLVFFGGVDADNYTERAIEALSDIAVTVLHVDVVIGAQHPYREQIKEACAQHRFICHIQTDKMAELMSTADLAIGAGGSATWERCSMGLPSIILVLADNQRKAAMELDAAGVLINLGDAGLVTKAELAQAIRELIEDEKLRSKLSVVSFMLVPLSKQSDVVEMMVGNNVQLR